MARGDEADGDGDRDRDRPRRDLAGVLGTRECSRAGNDAPRSAGDDAAEARRDEAAIGGGGLNATCAECSAASLAASADARWRTQTAADDGSTATGGEGGTESGATSCRGCRVSRGANNVSPCPPSRRSRARASLCRVGGGEGNIEGRCACAIDLNRRWTQLAFAQQTRRWTHTGEGHRWRARAPKSTWTSAHTYRASPRLQAASLRGRS